MKRLKLLTPLLLLSCNLSIRMGNYSNEYDIHSGYSYVICNKVNGGHIRYIDSLGRETIVTTTQPSIVCSDDVLQSEMEWDGSRYILFAATPVGAPRDADAEELLKRNTLSDKGQSILIELRSEAKAEGRELDDNDVYKLVRNYSTTRELYIIDNSEDIVYGPLSKAQFLCMRDSLKITSNLKFNAE